MSATPTVASPMGPDAASVSNTSSVNNTGGSSTNSTGTSSSTGTGTGTGKMVGRRSTEGRVWRDRFLLFTGLIAAWQAATSAGWIDPLIVGSPAGIAVYLYRNLFQDSLLLVEFGWTMLGTLSAFVLGSTAAILTGALFVMKPHVEKVVAPLLSALNAMPRIALAPLFLIWFGLGLGSKVAIGFSLCYFIVLSTTVAGGRSVSQDHLVLARTLGAGGWQSFVLFTLPSAVPILFSGLKLGLIYSLLGVVGGEIIAAEHGLGQQLSLLSAHFYTNGVLGILILLALVGMTISAAMDRLEAWLLRWK